MNKITACLVAAAFAFSAAGTFAAEKDAAKKPSAAECKKDPKMKGCEDGMKKK